MALRTLTLLVLGTTLSACGGGSTGGGTTTAPSPTFGGVLGASSSPTFDELQPVLQSAAAQEIRVAGFAGSRFSAIPDDRTVIFKGYGQLVLDYDPAISADVTVIGDTRVEVDFQTETFSGSVSNLVATNESDDVLGVIGTYDFTGGSVGGANPNNFSLSYDVDLLVGPNSVALDGTMDGIFRGTRADPGDRNPIKAIAASDTSPNISTGPGLNGATASVVGESFFPTE